ncbi:MAG: YraN family protein [Proteobacteria bacterium]|nr:YraN family protein [Pseudomonadota bacterium]
MHKARDDRRALGAEGEARAAAHLKRRGYRIVERNVRAGGVEIDIVAARGRLIVFAEVKTRRSDTFGPPEQAVDAAKQARIARGAAAWLRGPGGRRARVERVRFDVIACLAAPDGSWQIEHWEGAFDGN